MFENTGTTCKLIAQISFYLGITASVIAAIAAGWLIGSFLVFLIILIVGVPTAYLTSLPLYTLGEACEHNKEIRRMLADFRKPSGECEQVSADNLPEERLETQNNVATSIVNGDGTWICTCGREHQSYVSTCMCGTSKWDILNRK